MAEVSVESQTQERQRIYTQYFAASAQGLQEAIETSNMNDLGSILSSLASRSGQQQKAIEQLPLQEQHALVILLDEIAENVSRAVSNAPVNEGVSLHIDVP